VIDQSVHVLGVVINYLIFLYNDRSSAEHKLVSVTFCIVTGKDFTRGF